jgi:hypothetical protein
MAAHAKVRAHRTLDRRSTEDTLATMVEDSYLNHVPVMTGGVGRAELRQFYATHFIPKMPPDMEMTPLSRIIGTDQLVDEMVVRFNAGARPAPEIALTRCCRVPSSDLRRSFRCSACQHVALLTSEGLLRFGLSPAAKVLDLKGRLRCRGCGRKGRAVVSIKWRKQGS